MVKPSHSLVTNQVLSDVKKERDRQDEKWGVQNHAPAFWLVILGEEFGEVCKAILGLDSVGIRRELIHVAAVAVAAVESLDRQGVTREPYPGEEINHG